MKKRASLSSILFYFSLFVLQGQIYQDDEFSDAPYFEDQFYIGFGFNLQTNLPSNVDQRSFPYNLQTGFIKDIPFTKKARTALGIGLGYATNSYFSNIQAAETVSGIVYSRISENEDFIRSKLETHAIELPVEFRWRTSTATDHKFWRVYPGFKLAYAFARSSRFLTDETSTRFRNQDIQDLQYGLTLNIGYNTFNISAYYGLNPLLEEGVVLDTGEPFELSVLRIGVIFYIL